MKNIRTMIHEINKGKNLESNLSMYRTKLCDVYSGLSLLQLSMNSYVLWEKMKEEQGFSEFYAPHYTNISKAVSAITEPAGDEEELEKQIARLVEDRKDIMESMKVLTAYIDQLENVEYVLNRMELDYSESFEEEMKDDEFIRKTLEYILADRDAALINDKIRQVLGQLPFRMTRQRFFERLRESLTVYRGSEKSALDTFAYMVRTSGMVYETEQMKKSPYREQMKQITSRSFEKLSPEDYQKMVEQLHALAGAFQMESDWYVSVTEVINGLLVYCMTCLERLHMQDEVQPTDYEKDAMETLLQTMAWQEAELGLTNTGTSAEMMDMAYELFARVEGIQEELVEQQNLLEAVLVQASEQGEGFEAYSHMAKLMSTSYFAELQQEEEAVVDSELIDDLNHQLHAELSGFFADHERCLNRAVMANILTRMPVIFKSPEEIRNYIEYSLKQCSNKSEKEMSKRVILQMIRQ